MGKYVDGRAGGRRRWPMFSGVATTLLLAATAFALVYGLWSETLPINTSVAVGHTNADLISIKTNDSGKTADLKGKNVAICTGKVIDDQHGVITISNAYPGYACTFWTTIGNGGTLPERREPLEFEIPPELFVEEIGDLTGVTLKPGERDVEKFQVRVLKSAKQNTKYSFVVRKPFSLFATGTIGFWRNWDSHNMYTQAAINGWLVQINSAKAWQGPTTTAGMVTQMNAANGQNATPQSRFRAQCLATWLNVASGRMSASGTHNVKVADAANYLGLANPNASTLAEIQTAVEAKFGTNPTNAQFTIMKDVCDKINNLDIQERIDAVRLVAIEA